MTSSLLFGAFLAAAFYVLIPGPAFLALLGIGAGQGRRAGALFMSGHLIGDLVWSTLALVPSSAQRRSGRHCSMFSGFSVGSIWPGSAGVP